MARHADAVSGEMLNVVEDLRMIVRFEPGSAPDLEALWAAVTAAVFR